MLRGVAGGFLLAVTVVALTSVRISRMDVIRAIRLLPEGVHRSRRLPRRVATVAALVGVAMTVIGYQSPNLEAFLSGPVIVCISLGVLVRPRVSASTAVSVACVPLMIWVGGLFQRLNPDPRTRPVIAAVTGLLLTLAGVLFANAQQARVAGLARRLLGARGATTARLGLAYPVARQVRTALTVAPFALVIFTLTYTEGISNLVVSEVNRASSDLMGDYNVFVQSSASNPLPPAVLDEDRAVRSVSHAHTLVASFSREGESEQTLWPLTAFDADLTEATPPPLVARSPRFADDRAVYRAVAEDADTVIVSTSFLFSRERNIAPRPGQARIGRTPKVGGAITIFDPASERARTVTVVGVTYTDVVATGALYGRAGAEDLFGRRLEPNSAFVRASGDLDAFSTRVQDLGAPHGARAAVVAAAAVESFSFIADLVNLYRSDLGIGLVVGIAGIGVVLVRSVRERSRQIGTLRAMGFESRQIGASFLVEGAFVALQGIAVGVGLGIVAVLSATRTEQIRNLFGYLPPLTPPPVSLAVLALTLLVAALLASVGPARAAARIPPAVALRFVD